MKFMLLLYVDPELRDTPGARATMEEWFAFTRDVEGAGIDLGNNALQGLETATTVRVRDGETLISDGPFAETKEMLGGYYGVEVPDRDAALALAARVPSAPYGSIEVRPIRVFDDAP
jgi:hypothetical protein